MGSDSGSSQTILRGLQLLDAITEDIHDLEGLARKAGLTKSTAYRLLTTLVQAGYLRHIPRQGYYLGPKLIELGFKAYQQLHLPSVARPHLKWLAEQTQETVHLGVLDGNEVFYLDKVQGKRELQMASFIGGRQPAQCTGLGKALISALPPSEWPHHFIPGLKRTPNTITDREKFLEEIAQTARRGYAFDMEENEIGIRCIAAPIRDASGHCVGAISISSAFIYLDTDRMQSLIPVVLEAANRICRDLGWNTPAQMES